MRQLLAAALSLAVMVPAARAADGRFFLFMGDEPPQTELVHAAYREAQKVEVPLLPAVARERIGKVFPRLFASAASLDRAALEADLKAGRGAHFNGQYQDAEAAWARAFDAVHEAPEVLAEAKIFQRLVDGAATRYKNTLARKRPKAEARAQIEAFLERYPLASPTASDHAPEVIALWGELRKAAQAGFGSLVVNVHPVELERSAGCKLYLNGAEVADLPQPGPLGVPRGEHLLQVRCGPQLGWLQRVTIGKTPVTLRVPVRAMLSARGETVSGGVVLVSPSEGDAAALVEAVSLATGIGGAVVAVAKDAKMRFGHWETAADDPALASVGRIVGTNVEGVRVISKDGEGGGSGRVWTWVVGSLGVATLGGAVAANVVTADKISAGENDVEGLKTTTVALYVAGGVLVATGIILFFVEGGDDDAASASFAPGPGGLVVRF